MVGKVEMLQAQEKAPPVVMPEILAESEQAPKPVLSPRPLYGTI